MKLRAACCGVCFCFAAGERPKSFGPGLVSRSEAFFKFASPLLIQDAAVVIFLWRGFYPRLFITTGDGLQPEEGKAHRIIISSVT